MLGRMEAQQEEDWGVGMEQGFPWCGHLAVAHIWALLGGKSLLGAGLLNADSGDVHTLSDGGLSSTPCLFYARDQTTFPPSETWTLKRVRVVGVAGGPIQGQKGLFAEVQAPYLRSSVTLGN